MGKQRWEESEKRKEEERRSEKRKEDRRSRRAKISLCGAPLHPKPRFSTRKRAESLVTQVHVTRD